MIKEWLLRNRFVWRVNQIIKSRAVEKKYQDLMKYYSQISDEKTVVELMQEKKWNFSHCNKLKIFYLGTDELQDYGGFIQALEQKCDLRIFVKSDGSYGQYAGDDAREKNVDRVIELLNEFKKYNWEPDILLMQSFGYCIDTLRMEKLKNERGFKIINIGMDERLSYKLGFKNGYEQGISGLNEIIDLSLVTTPECVQWYHKEKIPSFHFPLASNENVYYPLDEMKKNDVGFIGRNYGLRSKVIEYLVANGINVKAYGPGWENGTLDVRENNKFYNSCKIVLGTGNIGYSEKLMNPKLRDYEVPLSGTLYMTNYTEELSSFFKEDDEMVFYRNKEELLDKIRFYLENDEERERIAENGYKRAISDHTYNKRLDQTFDLIFENIGR